MSDERQQLSPQQPGRQLTAVQQAAQKRAVVQNQMIEALVERRSEVETFLKPLGVDFDFFRSAAQMGLNRLMTTDETFFERVKVASFIREVIVAARLGLAPDGKKCAIVRYGDDCSCLPMVEGYIDVLGRTGMVRDVNHNVVIEGDFFDFEEGSNAFVRHKPSLTRDSNGTAIAAWCVIHTVNGGYYQEVVVKMDLDRIAATSKSKAGPRSAWAGEMHRKAPFRRLVKRLSKESNNAALQALIDIDDNNYTLTASGSGPRTAGPPRTALFADKRHERPVEEPEEIRQEPVETDTRRQTAAEPKAAKGRKGGKGAGKAKAAAPAAKDPTQQIQEDAERDDEERVSGVIAKRLADTTSVESLDEEWRTVLNAQKAGHTIAFSKETVEWLEQIRDSHRKHLEAEPEPAEEPPPLRLILKGGDEPVMYAEAPAWIGAFQDRLAAIKDQHHEAFWEANKAFVLEAVKIAPQEAQAILLAMDEKGFNVEPSDGH